MTARMNWRRARLQGRRTLDHRWDEFGEFRIRDRADRWLQVVERRLREQRTVRTGAVIARLLQVSGHERGGKPL